MMSGWGDLEWKETKCYVHSITSKAMFLVVLNYLASAASLSAASCTAVLSGSTLDAPVEHVIVLVAFTNEEVTEELAEVGVVRLVIETQSTGVVQEDRELLRVATAKQVRGGGHLLLHDPVVLLLLGSSLETLPGKRASQEVHENVGKRLEIITTSLFDTQVSVDRSVTSSTSQVLVLPVGDVEMGLWIPVLLGETEIDNVHLVTALADTHEEVVGLDVTVDEVPGVNILDSGNLGEVASVEGAVSMGAATYQLVSQ